MKRRGGYKGRMGRGNKRVRSLNFAAPTRGGFRL